MSGQSVAVFLYGLFMDEALLASKGIEPSSAAIGYVDGYGIRIGSRATLVPDRENRAHGVLMTMRPGDVEALYAGQSVADYVAESVTVILTDGSQAPATCYNLPGEKLESADVEYAIALSSLARKLDLPGDYVEQIEFQAK